MRSYCKVSRQNYSQTECPTCDATLTQSQFDDGTTVSFQPSQYISEQNFKDELTAINQSLVELKSAMDHHKAEKQQMADQIQWARVHTFRQFQF